MKYTIIQEAKSVFPIERGPSAMRAFFQDSAVCKQMIDKQAKAHGHLPVQHQQIDLASGKGPFRQQRQHLNAMEELLEKLAPVLPSS